MRSKQNRHVYRILKGIERENDTFYERYEPGAIVDLSHWPHEVLAIWVEQSVIEPVKGNKRYDSTTS